jgi:ATP synthase protein I
MPKTPDSGDDPFGRLDERLAAFDASREKPSRAGKSIGAGVSEGYRLIGQMLGGVFGGVGLGWLLDHFAHTRPFGLVVGLLVGTTMSIVATIRTANRMSAGQASVAPPSPPATGEGDVTDE